jgi:hypothetical protein
MSITFYSLHPLLQEKGATVVLWECTARIEITSLVSTAFSTSLTSSNPKLACGQNHAVRCLWKEDSAETDSDLWPKLQCLIGRSGMVV